MLKAYVKGREAVLRAVKDEDGVVSFEYVIVAACIIAVVAAVFATGGPIQSALSGAVSKIASKLASAIP
jgi:Flp pilus assembly pilin Flp